MFASFMETRPRAVQSEPEMEKPRATRFQATSMFSGLKDIFVLIIKLFEILLLHYD